jgi:molybdate transport system substrate-binding protein
VIAPSEDLFLLMKKNEIEAASRRALGETEVGVAVKAGAPLPDISTRDALRATLLAAHWVVIVDPTKGTSGRLVESLFKELHIDEAMQPKLIKVDGGYVVEAIARGEADLGLHQISEILPVAGVRLVGPLPGDLQRLTRYDVAMLSKPAHRVEAEALIRDLDSREAHDVIQKSGFMTAR